MVITKTLDSGIRVVMEQIDHVQSVAIGIWVKTGAVDETDKYAGISHFVEHMMFKGTANRTAKQIASEIDRIGGQINAFTGKEATCYYVKAINSNYKKAADVLCDMLENSCFDREEMNKERKVICEEIKMTNDAPDELAHETITSLIFKGNPLGKSIIGTPTSLKRITRNVMQNYVNQEYSREQIVVSVAGNFDPDDLCSYFEGKFLGLQKGKPAKSDTFAAYVPRFKTITKDIEQSHLCLGVKGLPIDDENIYAFGILNNLMGGSMSSRFFQNIREQKGLAYSVYSMQANFGTDGYYNIYAGISHDKIKDAIGGIFDELEMLDKYGVTKDELDSSREQLKASYIFAQENVSGRMFRNGKYAVLNKTLKTPEETIAAYDKVTMEDVERVKRLICNFDQYSAALVTNQSFDLKKAMRG